MHIRYRGNPSTEQLSNDNPSIVDVVPGRYQATAVVPLFASRSLPSSGSVRHNIFQDAFSLVKRLYCPTSSVGTRAPLCLA
jgi:hypothetical protein